MVFFWEGEDRSVQIVSKNSIETLKQPIADDHDIENLCVDEYRTGRPEIPNAPASLQVFRSISMRARRMITATLLRHRGKRLANNQ